MRCEPSAPEVDPGTGLETETGLAVVEDPPPGANLAKCPEDLRAPCPPGRQQLRRAASDLHSLPPVGVREPFLGVIVILRPGGCFSLDTVMFVAGGGRPSGPDGRHRLCRPSRRRL